MKLGVVQMESGSDPWLNLLLVQDFINEAKSRGCAFISFPENVFYRGPKKRADGGGRDEATLAIGKDGRIARDTPFASAVAEAVENAGLAVGLGSVLERTGEVLPYNSHWIVDGTKPVTAYRKIHLFDFTSATGEKYLESSEVGRGQELVTCQLGPFKTTLAICYDLRFAELFRAGSLRRGSQLILLPAAFTRSTGEAHWHTLLRARAIENLSFVAAAAQWGEHEDSKGQKLFCFGHAMIISPWGEILAEGPSEGDALVVADIDASEVERRRGNMPALTNAKFFEILASP